MIGRLLRRLHFIRRYRGRPPWDTGIAPPELKDYIARQTPGRALDLGCGTGASCLALAEAGWQVTGVDFVPAAIQAARRRLAAAGLQADLRVADVTRLPGISGPFNLALDIGCYHSLSRADREKVRARLRELLAPGGAWMMYGHMKSGDGPTGLDEDDLADLVAEFALLQRIDSVDPTGPASTWITLRKEME